MVLFVFLENLSVLDLALSGVKGLKYDGNLKRASRACRYQFPLPSRSP